MTSRVDRFPFAATGPSGFAWHRLAFWFGLTLLAIVLFGATFAIGYASLHQSKILPGVTVAGVDVAGLDQRAAERALRGALPDLRAGSLTVRVGGLEESIPYAEIDRDYDFDHMLGQALAIGRGGNPLDQLREQVALLQNGASVEPVMTWNSEALAERVAELAIAAQVPVVDATISRSGGIYTIAPASAGLSIDVDAVVGQAMAAVDSLSAADTEIVVAGTTVVPTVSTASAAAAADAANRVAAEGLTVSGAELSTTIEPATLRGWVHLDETSPGQWQVSIAPEPVTEWVATYAGEVHVPATNATFAVSGGGIDVVPSAIGRAVEVEPTAASLLGALQARVDGRSSDPAVLSFAPVQPALTTDEARAIAPRVQKLSSWTTNFVPGPLNGDGVNIQVPTSILDGYVVEPGATFDFLDAIGPVTTPPYVSGGALVRGQIKEDGAIGGGMCSTSTTLFNAALRYGLPITARDNHSLYINRYPVGLDATVWMTSRKNRQTMAFLNDTGYPLVVRGINSPGAVTFELWGVHDGRTVEIQEPRVENVTPPSFIYVEYTDELRPGRRVRVNEAYESFDSWVTRIVRNAAGEVLIEETYRSQYKMLPAYLRVGRSDGDPRSGRVVRLRVEVDNGP